MNRLLQKLIVIVGASSPMWALAHVGHEHTHTHTHLGFEAGFIHPFTGLDHMMMALALGVLFYSALKRWQVTGLVSMVVALVAGFAMGTAHLMPESFAEYGIVASLIAVAVALWSKSKMILPVATAMLVTFHGVAHGAELGHSGHFLSLVSGMVAAMSLIYVAGLFFGKFIVEHIPYGKKIIGGLAVFIALIGLA
ncbi:HupE/UreJ family protein [Acinetobacter sp. Marseille-Q1618]|uniref:HupE/UreJ family protein n=1 Tax=Acinetobacter sp. Marseille-Q1618 TaxID=2697502 RepID=UPI00156DA740|nr:HupE/UreJ family protein [Acinetobacter sp. Marseille-Q1618]